VFGRFGSAKRDDLIGAAWNAPKGTYDAVLTPCRPAVCDPPTDEEIESRDVEYTISLTGAGWFTGRKVPRGPDDVSQVWDGTPWLDPDNFCNDCVSYGNAAWDGRVIQYRQNLRPSAANSRGAWLTQPGPWCFRPLFAVVPPLRYVAHNDLAVTYRAVPELPIVSGGGVAGFGISGDFTQNLCAGINTTSFLGGHRPELTLTFPRGESQERATLTLTWNGQSAGLGAFSTAVWECVTGRWIQTHCAQDSSRPDAPCFLCSIASGPARRSAAQLGEGGIVGMALDAGAPIEPYPEQFYRVELFGHIRQHDNPFRVLIGAPEWYSERELTLLYDSQTEDEVRYMHTEGTTGAVSLIFSKRGGAPSTWRQPRIQASLTHPNGPSTATWYYARQPLTSTLSDIPEDIPGHWAPDHTLIHESRVLSFERVTGDAD
jgi:hypothetical protein